MQQILLWLLLAGFSSAQDPTIPARAMPLLSADARGVQIYSCMRQGDQLQWIFKAPEATLLDSTGATVGRHGAGPSWTWADGSTVKGTVVKTQPSPSPGNVAWLLLSALASPDAPGTLSHVTWVRRHATHGGVAPANGCDAAHEHDMVRVPYSATYTFYTELAQP